MSEAELFEPVMSAAERIDVKVMKRPLIAIAIVILGSTTIANAQQGQQQPKSQALVLPQQANGGQWAMVLPPLKPNPYADGQWSVESTAPREKWSADDARFSSQQACQAAVRERANDLLQAIPGEGATAQKQVQSAAASGNLDSAQITKIIGDETKTLANINLLFAQVQFAKCEQR
jgi:hypothetical protein